MLRQNLWIGVVALGVMAGCERREQSVDVSPSRPAEPSVDTRNPSVTTQSDDRVGSPEGTEANRDMARTDDSLRGSPTLGNDKDNDDDELGIQQGGLSTASAVSSIVAARCAREQTCKNIGADEKYKSVSECQSKLSEDRKDDLNAEDCPRGVSKKELQECLAEIKNEDCNNPLDSLGRLAACRSSDLCMATP